MISILHARIRASYRSPAEALRAAAVHPAEFLGRLDRAGSIAPGKDADLVLLDGDPLGRYQEHAAHLGRDAEGQAAVVSW